MALKDPGAADNLVTHGLTKTRRAPKAVTPGSLTPKVCEEVSSGPHKNGSVASGILPRSLHRKDKTEAGDLKLNKYVHAHSWVWTVEASAQSKVEACSIPSASSAPTKAQGSTSGRSSLRCSSHKRASVCEDKLRRSQDGSTIPAWDGTGNCCADRRGSGNKCHHQQC